MRRIKTILPNKKKGYILAYAVVVLAVVMLMVSALLAITDFKSKQAIKNKQNFEIRVQILAVGEKFIGKRGEIDVSDWNNADFTVLVTQPQLGVSVLTVHTGNLLRLEIKLIWLEGTCRVEKYYFVR